MGRPRKLTRPRQKIFLARYAESLNKSASAEAAGVDRHTVNREIENNPDFAFLVREAEADAGDRLLTTVMRYGIEGVPYTKEKFDAKGNLIMRETGTRVNSNLAWNLAQRFAGLLLEKPEPPQRVDMNLAGQKGGEPIPVKQQTDESILDSLPYETLKKLRDMKRAERQLLERSGAFAGAG